MPDTIITPVLQFCVCVCVCDTCHMSLWEFETEADDFQITSTWIKKKMGKLMSANLQKVDKLKGEQHLESW